MVVRAKHDTGHKTLVAPKNGGISESRLARNEVIGTPRHRYADILNCMVLLYSAQHWH
jgi:hypothetical protein